MPAPKKRPSDRQDNRKARAPLAVLPPPSGELGSQEPDEAWLPETSEGWRSFWASDVAQAVRPAQLPVLRRLFRMRDLQARAFARYETQPYVDGSTGQPVTNPAFADAMKLESACVALEDRLGLTPKAEVALGIAIGQAALTAADLNAMSTEAHADPDKPAEVVDVEGWEAV